MVAFTAQNILEFTIESNTINDPKLAVIVSNPEKAFPYVFATDDAFRI